MLNILSGQQWLLAGIAFVAAVVLVMILLRYNEGFWGTLGLAAVLGGTLGNLTDRIFNGGKVVDMFKTLFIPFPIFNIADIFITLGFITFLIHFIALTIREGKSESLAGGKTKGNNAQDDYAQDDYAEEEYPEEDYVQESYAESEIAEDGYVQEDYVQEQQVASPEYSAPEEYTPLEQELSDLGDYDSITDTTPDMSFTLEDIQAELESDDYNVDDLLREYGFEDNDDY